MQTTRVILPSEQLELVLERLCCQLIEDYDDFQNTCIVGIQTGGVRLGLHLLERLSLLTGIPKSNFEFGKLDITFYRDDFRTRKSPLKAHTMDMPFLVEDKRVILLDDVLFTGRSVHAAMTGLSYYGRPRSVRLLTLVDRRFQRQIPIRPDYVGITVDSVEDAFVRLVRADIGYQLILDAQ